MLTANYERPAPIADAQVRNSSVLVWKNPDGSTSCATSFNSW
jgi:hypothetical protein